MGKKMLKMFFSFGIPFGVIMGFFEGVWSGLFSGILFGFFMAVVLGYWHAKSVKRKTSGGKEGDYSSKQTREIDLPVSYDEAYELCLKSFDKLRKPEIQSKDHSQGIITAKAGKTWDTWGDTVSLKITQMENNNTRVTVSSEPTYYQIVDYGKNLENVNNIISFLEEQAGRSVNHRNGSPASASLANDI